MSIEKIGKLSLDREQRLGKGCFGTVFCGKYGKNKIDVAIKRLDKVDVLFDLSAYRKAEGHPNIIRYYCTKRKDVEFK